MLEKMGKRGIILTSIVFVLVAAASFAASERTPASESVNVSDLHQIESTPRSAIDALPDLLLNGDQASDLLVDTAHYLGDSHFASYWSVLHQDGRLCFVVAPIAEETVAGTCADAKTFSESGAVISIQDPTNPSTSFAAYLLPDTVSAAKTPQGFERVASNLVEIQLGNESIATTRIGTPDHEVVLRGIEALK